MTLTTRVLIALVAGFAGGLALRPVASATGVSQFVATLEVIGSLWVNAIRMTVVPLVVSLLVTGVSSAADARVVRSVGGRAFASFIGLLGLAAVVGLLIVPLLFAGLTIDPATSASLRESAVSGASEVVSATKAVPTFSQFLTNLIPINPVKAAADGAMLPLVIFSVLFGFALLRLSTEQRAPVLAFFKALGDAILVLVRWIISLSPVGVFCLMLPMVSRTGLDTASALTYYIVAMAAANVILIILLYPTVWIVARVSMARFARAALPAQAVAVSTRSSLASLPALIEGAETRLGLPESVTRVALPLAVSTFKIGSPVVWTVASIFLARLYGVDLTMADRLTIAATAALSSFSVPGVPHGWLLLLSPLIASLGIPVESIALLFAVDVIPDTFATTLNVTADMASVAIVAEGPGAEPHGRGTGGTSSTGSTRGT
ncbi:MAG: dicarboxylate/amino acid:cation symporter [Gemmatimonadetes bacterium]|nr:dicarboxylate/amino acid:cation symporter [Gemmatimonadota bacterium]